VLSAAEVGNLLDRPALPKPELIGDPLDPILIGSACHEGKLSEAPRAACARIIRS
jgi:hypothetical protein